ncbi:MAG: acyltransferase family protein [Flavobacteriales bacterium]
MLITQGSRIPAVTMLRGLAALGVCIMHFAGTLEPGTIQDLARIGGYGVPVFFVISGFILPYSMEQDQYALNNYGSFLLKRIIRLDPPYLLTIIGIAGLSVIAQWSPYHTASAVEVMNGNGALHLFYGVDIFGGTWLNPVFWTLAIEFQFYLLIGLLFPLLLSKNDLFRLILFIGLCSLPFLVKDDRFVSDHVLLFLPGILLFCFVTEKIDRKWFFGLCSIVLVAGYAKSGISAVICPVCTLCFLLLVKTSFRPLMFLGTISYSLYLIHTPLGTDGLINFFQNIFTTQPQRIVLALVALPVTVCGAWLFYRIVEKPSIRTSRFVAYKRRKI